MNDSMRAQMEQLLQDVRKRLWTVYEEMLAGELSEKEWKLVKNELVQAESGLVAALKGGA